MNILDKILRSSYVKDCENFSCWVCPKWAEPGHGKMEGYDFHFEKVNKEIIIRKYFNHPEGGWGLYSVDRIHIS